MFQHSESGSTNEPVSQGQRSFPLPPPDQSVLRIFMLGDVETLRRMIGRLATNGIADANSWSQPQETGRTGEFITVHTKRMATEVR
ncbi:hypothetical protein C7271_10625 [filamentous cyanobacterium CCP5]|nr:hypothetical protein C7271_10625 [filamentous cyanobacterium CCP5]